MGVRWVKHDARWAPGVTGLGALLCALPVALSATPALAYSAFADYAVPIDSGGGGGRWFTGTPADGYDCSVCHAGAQGAELSVTGLPSDGYVPSQAYEIAFRWGPGAEKMALMVELTDGSGSPIGTTAIPSYATWDETELCEDGSAPAADVCRMDGREGACCRQLDPTRDACSFAGDRSVLWVPDCGSSIARMVWTAPDEAEHDVWFSAGMVTSDGENDAHGDGVTVVRELIRPQGTSSALRSAAGDCHAPHGGATPSSGRAMLAWLISIALATRFRRRVHTTSSHRSNSWRRR